MAPARRTPETRERIIEAATRLIEDEGYGAATIRSLAAAAGLSKTGMLHHFATKEEVLVEVLRRRDHLPLTFQGATARDLFLHAAAVVHQSATHPRLVELYVRLAVDASDPDHAAHAFFAERTNRLHRLGQEAFRRLEQEHPSARFDAESASLLLLALLDGLQLRLMYDPDLDVGRHLDALLTVLPRDVGQLSDG